jgi:hypothetical protein
METMLQTEFRGIMVELRTEANMRVFLKLCDTCTMREMSKATYRGVMRWIRQVIGGTTRALQELCSAPIEDIAYGGEQTPVSIADPQRKLCHYFFKHR